MPTVVVIPRKAHVKRVYRIAPDDTIDSAVWIDVLRIDEWLIVVRGLPSAKKGLLIRYFFKWWDGGGHGGDVQHENANKKRRTQHLTVHNPQVPDSDKTSDILLWIVNQMQIKLPAQHADDYTSWNSWAYKYAYDNSPTNTIGPSRPARRKVNDVRVVNNDLAGLDMSGTVDWLVYEKALLKGTKDTDQYVDVEVIENFVLDKRGEADQKRTKNLFVFQNINVANLINDGHADPTKVLRLDPFQTIVNVSWDVVPEFLALEISPIGVLEQNGFSFVNVWGQALFGQPSQWVHRFDPATGHTDWHWVQFESGDDAVEAGFPDWRFIQPSIFFPPTVATHLIHHWVSATFFEIWYSELSQSGSPSIRPTPVPTPDVLPDNVTPITWEGTDVGVSVVMAPGGDGPFADTFAAGTGTLTLRRRGHDYHYNAVGGGLVVQPIPHVPPPFNRIKNSFTLLLQRSLSP